MKVSTGALNSARGKSRLWLIGATIVALLLIGFATVELTTKPTNSASSGASSESQILIRQTSVSTGANENLTTTSRSSTSTETALLGTETVNGYLEVGTIKSACNCSMVVGTQTFPTLHDLVEESTVLLVNVTAATTVSVNGIPFMVYTITNIETILNLGASNGYRPPPGTNGTLAWIGGTVNDTTMTPVGYPTLRVGATYVVFLTDSFPSGYSPYWEQIDNESIDGPANITAGGAEGLFYVQNGNVFSLDNLYPQVDGWIPVKADGIPLSQFVSEVQSG